jgi:hypothetical protein
VTPVQSCSIGGSPNLIGVVRSSLREALVQFDLGLTNVPAQGEQMVVETEHVDSRSVEDQLPGSRDENPKAHGVDAVVATV